MANVKVTDGKTMWIRVSGALYEAVEVLAIERELYHGTNEDGTPKPNISGMARVALRTGVGALRGNGNGREKADAGE